MSAPVLLPALLALAPSGPQDDWSRLPPLEVRVDARVELLTAVARLAGFHEFDMPNSDSPYARRVEEYFGPMVGEHPVFEHLQRLRAERGVSYDAIPSLAVHLGPLPDLAELVPFDESPERLDARWGGVAARSFLAELRDFAEQTEALAFLDGEQEFHREATARLSARLAESVALPWFDAFFGKHESSRVLAIPGLLCGGGNFGVGVRYPDGREELTPVFGCWKWDAEGLPVYDVDMLPLFVHEVCHSYTNAFVDRFADELEPAMSRIFATCADVMTRQAYGSWRIVAYESLVRASVVRCRRVTEGEEAAAEQARTEVQAGFTWTPGLAALLGEFEAERTRYPTFADFMPRVVAFFEAEAGRVAQRTATAPAPSLVSSRPADGASDVAPGDSELVLTFDRPMLDRGWSIVCPPDDVGMFTGAPAYDAERKVLRVPVRLEGGRSYSLWLNDSRRSGFRSAEGTPLEPVHLVFTTRP